MIPFQKTSETEPNRSPLDVFNIKASPENFEASLKRHGQATRIIQSRLCHCNVRGHASMYCDNCNGKGFVFYYQTTMIVVDENSAKNDCFEIFPYGTPITRVIKVQKPALSYQGGIVDYEVVDFDDEKISICGKPFQIWEKFRVTYEYSLLIPIENESPVVPEEGYVIILSAPIELEGTANPYEISGDVIEVTRVYNVTKDVTYTVRKINKQTVFLVDNGTPIEVTDDLQVDYKYIKPFSVATGRIKENNNFNVASEDIKEGDIQAVFSAGIHLSKSDIITFLAGRRQDNNVLTRGSGSSEEIPQFDVFEIQRIIDEDGNEYTSNDYYLFNYNEIKWKAGGSSPATGKKYNVEYLYRPSYRIYKENADYMNNENKYFVQYAMLRYENKFDKKEKKIK